MLNSLYDTLLCCVRKQKTDESDPLSEKEKGKLSKDELEQFRRKIKFEDTNQNANKYFDPTLDLLLIDSKYIREDEKSYIKYSKIGLVNFIEKISDEEENPWTLLYHKDSLTLHYRKGSIMNKELFVGRCIYKLKKSLIKENLDTDKIIKLLYVPELRLKWDHQLSSYKILGKIGEKSSISQMKASSSALSFSEREFIDKRIEFTYNDSYYNFSSSVDIDHPSDPEVTKCFTYFNILILNEEDDNFTFTYLFQYDIKVNES